MSIRSGNQAHKIGRNTKVHVTVDAFGMPIWAIVTDGKKATRLKEKYLLTDKGYDTQEILDFAKKNGKNLSFFQQYLEKFNDIIIRIYIKYVIWLKICF